MELYIHIPFCKHKCAYCSFVSFPASEKQKDEYIEALLQEAEIRKNEIQEPVATAYIGGGTPSMLSPDQLTRLICGLQETFSLDACSEFTVEANPGTISESFLKAASALDVNRLSLGMQAFQDHLLSFLGRIHSFRDVKESVRLARESGIHNLNLDLIFGIPGQTIWDWNETLDAALSLHPQHISAYGLIPEEGTPFYDRLLRKECSLPEPELEREMYDLAMHKLAENGLQQYEISNFSAEGFECRHNIGYWTQEPYIGLGVSAASMRITEKNSRGMSCLRQTNPDTMEQYLQAVHGGCAYVPHETIPPKDSRFETMMLALRMNQGIRPGRFEALHGVSLDSCYGKQLNTMRELGLMQFSGGAWSLTRRGMDIQNSILVEFMDDA